MVGNRQNGVRRSFRGQRSTRPFELVTLLLAALVVLGLSGEVPRFLGESGLASWILDGHQRGEAATAPAYSRKFAVCGGGARTTCVVDGDTFWLDGVKIRIADINTPEVSAPQCAAEAALGQRATMRLAALLNDGPFDIVRSGRDEDQYGRKLRIVEREGRSLGAQLVAEGLAHEWGGHRQSWC